MLGADGYYNLHRWYTPGVGRYSRPDPLGLDGGRNLFSYAASNPLTMLDPLGLKVELYCHPVGAGGGDGLRRAAGRAGFGHCFVRVVCDCPDYDLRLEVTGRDEETGLGVIPANPPNFATGHNASIVPFSPSDWTSDDCSTENCIRQKYQELRDTGFRYGTPPLGWLTGPNSNTFSQELLRSCGIQKIYWPDGITGVERPEE
jgi:hypothetical protein